MIWHPITNATVRWQRTFLGTRDIHQEKNNDRTKISTSIFPVTS
jgi:hypothetical protein